MIGDYLTEINVTSPTGLRQINRLEGVQLEDTVIDWLEPAVRRAGPRLLTQPPTRQPSAGDAASPMTAKEP